MVKKKVKKKESKFMITGMGNDGFRYKIEIKKIESFKKPFVDFLIELGFEEWEFDYILQKYEGKKKIKISDLGDWVSHSRNKYFEIDIFYGDKKIFLIIRTRKRAKLIKILEKYSKWIKPKKFPKSKFKKSKK